MHDIMRYHEIIVWYQREVEQKTDVAKGCCLDPWWALDHWSMWPRLPGRVEHKNWPRRPTGITVSHIWVNETHGFCWGGWISWINCTVLISNKKMIESTIVSIRESVDVRMYFCQGAHYEVRFYKEARCLDLTFSQGNLPIFSKSILDIWISLVWLILFIQPIPNLFLSAFSTFIYYLLLFFVYPWHSSFFPA